MAGPGLIPFHVAQFLPFQAARAARVFVGVASIVFWTYVGLVGVLLLTLLVVWVWRGRAD